MNGPAKGFQPAARARNFFRLAKAQCVLRVVTIFDFERSSRPLSIGGNSASQKLLRDRNSGLYNRQDVEKDTLF